MTPEMQEAFWEAFEKTFDQNYGEPFEDAFHDVGDEKEDDNVDDKNQHASFNVDEWIAILLEQPDEVETKDQPISRKRCARLRKLTEDEPQKCKEWSTICPAVKNYIPIMSGWSMRTAGRCATN